MVAALVFSCFLIIVIILNHITIILFDGTVPTPTSQPGFTISVALLLVLGPLALVSPITTSMTLASILGGP